MENEIWKDVKDYEGLYMVSNYGNIKSVTKVVSTGIKNNPKRIINSKVIRQFSDKDGYLYLGLTKNGKKKTNRVHRVVCSAFHENNCNKPHVNHKNGIKNDNRAENLEWATLSENRIHSYNTGLQSGINRRGEKNNFTKLTKKEVIDIKNRYIPYKLTNLLLAKEYNVTVGCIQRITSGKNWGYL